MGERVVTGLRALVREPVFLTTIFTIIGVIVIYAIPVPERAPQVTVQGLSVQAPAVTAEACAALEQEGLSAR